MRRVVILGRGAAGKSTLAVRLGERLGLPVIELDGHFWRENLTATSRQEWVATQQRLAEREEWVMDGDLGPYDVVDIRLRTADTIVLLNFSLARCAWRALRRSRERADFWRWLITYRRGYLPALRTTIGAHGEGAVLHELRRPREVDDFIARLGPPAG
jgi:adenylate kinase family enzyme